MTADGLPDEDTLLVAYLDGELDADARAEVEELLRTDAAAAGRLAFLARSALPFADAFRPMLAAAPVAVLEARLDAVPTVAARQGWRRRDMLAAGIATFFAGALVGRASGMLGNRGAAADADRDDDWREVVAQYLSLYTAETLANLPTDEAAVGRQLADAGAAARLALPAMAVTLPGARLKRAQVFRYDEVSLTQIAYLDSADRPLALCIVARTGEGAPVASETRRGMNIAFWSSPAHGFMLIGHLPAPEIETLAAGLSARLGA